LPGAIIRSDPGSSCIVSRNGLSLALRELNWLHFTKDSARFVKLRLQAVLEVVMFVFTANELPLTTTQET